MVGQAVVREVVGANPLAAVAGADECAALVRPLVVLLLPLEFIEPRLENSQGLREILVLTLFILALHDQPGLVMR